MTSDTQYIHEPGSGEVLIVRTVNYPRDLVFQAWTDPEMLINWWGPKGFYQYLPRNRRAPGRDMALHYARPRRNQLSQQDHF